MPLVSFGTIALFIGMYAGFAGIAMYVSASCALLFLVGVRSRDARIGAAAMLVMAGALIGYGARLRDADCRQRASTKSSWRVTLGSRGAPTGGIARANWSEDGCDVPMIAMVERGKGAPGSVAEVSGQGSAGSANVVVDRAEVTSVAPPPLRERWRAAVGARIDFLFRSDAPLVKALVIADEKDIPAEVRQRWAAAGIVHMLSVSGLHVAIVAGTLHLLLIALRLRPNTALIAATLGVALYVALLGAPPPALRSGAMLAVAAMSKLSQRPTSPWAALAIGALLPLIDPRTVLDLGYQLSVAGMAALVASGALRKRVLNPRLSGWRLTISGELLTSTIACLVTLPLVAGVFGQVSVIAPLANLVASPVMSLALPIVFLALVCWPVDAIAKFVALGAHAPLSLFGLIADRAGGLPGASVSVHPSQVTCALLAAAAVAGIVACTSRFPSRPAVVGLFALASAAWVPSDVLRSRDTELHMIDVGQGDAIALRSSLGHWILVDAGRIWEGGDAGRADVIPYVKKRGGDVRALLLSHPHSDHIGGAASVIASLHPRVVWEPGFVASSSIYEDVLSRASSEHVAWHRAQPGDTMRVDEILLRVLAPDSAWTAAQRDANETSVVVLVTVGRINFLLTGDAEAGEEHWIVDRGDGLRADVLKVGHHGSHTSTSPEFIAAVRPRLALVSVGALNAYGHPSASVMAALSSAGARVLRTDRVGTVVVRTDGVRLTVSTNDDEWDLPAGSSRP